MLASCVYFSSDCWWTYGLRWTHSFTSACCDYQCHWEASVHAVSCCAWKGGAWTLVQMLLSLNYTLAVSFGLTKSRPHDHTVRETQLHAVCGRAARPPARPQTISNLLLMFFPVSFNFKLLAIGFTILKSEISLDVKSVLWQCIYSLTVCGWYVRS